MYIEHVTVSLIYTTISAPLFYYFLSSSHSPYLQTEEDDGDSDSYIGSQETGDELGGGDYEYRPARALVSSQTESEGDSSVHAQNQDTAISTHLNLASLCADSLVGLITGAHSS